MIPLGIILYYFATRGSPILLDQPLSYSNNQGSWIYSVANPLFGIIFIGIGFFGDAHPLFRITCLIGCGGEVFGNSLIIYQVYYYIQQVMSNSSPSYKYSLYGLRMLYWSNVVSIAMCTFIFMTSALLCCIVGWCSPQLIHPSHISGRDMDRCEVMRTQRLHRALIEKYVFGINNSEDKSVELVSLKPTNNNTDKISITDKKMVTELLPANENISSTKKKPVVADEESGTIF